MPLELNPHTLDDFVVVQFRGNLDRSTAPHLHDRLFTLASQPKPCLITDLSGLDFIDTSGLRALLSCQLRARLLGGGLALACASQTVLRQLHAMGLDERSGVYPTVEEAAQTTRDPAGNADTDGLIDLIVADRVRIYLRWEGLRDTARFGAQADAARTLARQWDEVAEAIDVHLAAVEEICLPAIPGIGPQARQHIEAVIANHDDIRELLGETFLQPADSPLWWRLLDDAWFLWREQTEREAAGMLAGFALRADDALRHRLGREWLAFFAAQRKDRTLRWPDGRCRGLSGTPTGGDLTRTGDVA